MYSFFLPTVSPTVVVHLLPSHLPSPSPIKVWSPLFPLETAHEECEGRESSQVLLHGDGEHASPSLSNIGRYVMMRARFMHPSRIGTSGHFFTVTANTSVGLGGCNLRIGKCLDFINLNVNYVFTQIKFFLEKFIQHPYNKEKSSVHRAGLKVW